jgi:chromosomal replication initiation ATPase DnaA
MSAHEFTPEDLERADANYDQTLEARRATAQSLAMQVARRHGLSVEDMLSRRRYAHLAVARVDLYLALRGKGWSYPAIGRFVERDHTTIIAALWTKERKEARRQKGKVRWATR